MDHPHCRVCDERITYDCRKYAVNLSIGEIAKYIFMDYPHCHLVCDERITYGCRKLIIYRVKLLNIPLWITLIVILCVTKELHMNAGNMQ
jgi:hypothetical protein